LFVLTNFGFSAGDNLVGTIWEVETVTNIWINYHEYQQGFSSAEEIPGAKQITVHDFQQDQIIAQIVDSLGNLHSSTIAMPDNPYSPYRLLFTESRVYVWSWEDKRYFFTTYQVNGDIIHIMHPSETVDILGTVQVHEDTLIVEEIVNARYVPHKHQYVYRYHAIDTLNPQIELAKVKNYKRQKGFDLSGPGPFPD
jgi:hypothetical protein